MLMEEKRKIKGTLPTEYGQIVVSNYPVKLIHKLKDVGTYYYY